MMDTPCRQRGFSLVELMVVIVVAAILVAIALPSFRDVIRRNQVSGASNTLLASLDYARTEAITRGQLVSMCPSTDGASCTSAGKAFDPGWIIYTYPAGAASANKAYSASGAILMRAITARPSVSIQAKSTEVISYGQQGQLVSSVSTTPTLTFATCFRSGSTGTGQSTTTVPGVEMDVNGSGSVTSKPWTVGAACTP